MNKKEERFFEQIYVLYADDLYNYGRQMGLGADDVNDLMHDMFLHFMLKMPNISKIENLRAFLFYSFHNKIIDLYRKRKSQKLEFGFFEAEEIIDDTERYSVAQQIESELNKAIGELPESQRISLTLRYFQSFSYDEVAQIIGCTPHAARKFVSKAVCSLRKKFIDIEKLLNK